MRPAALTQPLTTLSTTGQGGPRAVPKPPRFFIGGPLGGLYSTPSFHTRARERPELAEPPVQTSLSQQATVHLRRPSAPPHTVWLGGSLPEAAVFSAAGRLRGMDAAPVGRSALRYLSDYIVLAIGGARRRRSRRAGLPRAELSLLPPHVACKASALRHNGSAVVSSSSRPPPCSSSSSPLTTTTR